MRTSCRFAMAVHVLALLAYNEGDRVTSACLAGSINTNPVIVRRLLLVLQRARLIDTCKGAGAGSRLNYAPKRINMAQIYRAVEAAEAFTTSTRLVRVSRFVAAVCMVAMALPIGEAVVLVVPS